MTDQRPLTALILAAGKGTRMKSDQHKVLHPVGGLPMVMHLLDTLDSLADMLGQPLSRALVVGAMKDQLATALPGEKLIQQDQQLGTGHAVRVAEPALTPGSDLLILFGDTPLISPTTLARMMDALTPTVGAVVLGFETSAPKGYGRLIEENGNLARIVEEKDATPAEKAVTLCNSGVMLLAGDRAFDWINALDCQNAAGEYYLTDVIALARRAGCSPRVVRGPADEVQGVNSRADLAHVEALFQARKRAEIMADGASLVSPETVFFSHDTHLEADVRVEPNVVFGPGVTVKSHAVIKAFSHLEGCTIGAQASVGPFARIRPGSDIGALVKIGNFVETKKAVIAKDAKVSHLSYIGDAQIGSGANIGAGTITCNYDGYNKSVTAIGSGAFIGSNSALVAPVVIGDGAIVAAGSVITRDVPNDDLALARGKQENKKGAAVKMRDRQIAKKNKGKTP